MFKNLPSFLLSTLIHGALIALVVFGYDWQSETQQPFSQQPVEIVKAVVIDDGRLQAEMEKLQEKAKQKQAELEQQALLAEQIREAEEKRLVELEKQQEEEKHRAEEKVKQEAEVKRLAEVKKKQDTEKKQKEALEAKKSAEEKKRVEHEKKKEAEKKQLAEEVKRKKEKEAIEAEAKRKTEEEAKVKRDAELQRQRAAEQRRLQTLREKYIAMIGQHVERYWRKPPSAVLGLSCTVKVKQIPGGEVISARVDICNGDLVVHRSIEAAVLRASPLPVPPDPALFDRNLEFTFKPRD